MAKGSLTDGDLHAGEHAPQDDGQILCAHTARGGGTRGGGTRGGGTRGGGTSTRSQETYSLGGAWNGWDGEAWVGGGGGRVQARTHGLRPWPTCGLPPRPQTPRSRPHPSAPSSGALHPHERWMLRRTRRWTRRSQPQSPLRRGRRGTAPGSASPQVLAAGCTGGSRSRLRRAAAGPRLIAALPTARPRGCSHRRYGEGRCQMVAATAQARGC